MCLLLNASKPVNNLKDPAAWVGDIKIANLESSGCVLNRKSGRRLTLHYRSMIQLIDAIPMPSVARQGHRTYTVWMVEFGIGGKVGISPKNRQNRYGDDASGGIHLALCLQSSYVICFVQYQKYLNLKKNPTCLCSRPTDRDAVYILRIHPNTSRFF